MSSKLDQLDIELRELEIRNEQIEIEKNELELRKLKREDDYNESLAAYACEYPFVGRVDETSVKTCMDTLARWSRRDPDADMTIVLNSPGGSVFHGLALVDFLERLKDNGHHLTIVTRGWAASMGGVLLQLGDHRIIGKNSHVMIHEVSSLGVGKLSEMMDEVELCKRLWNDRLVPILAERSTLSPRQIKNRSTRKDWWLDANECIKYGFADLIA